MKLKRVELFLEHFMFGSRWLLVPFYLGLIAGIALLLVKFAKAFVSLVPVVFNGDGGSALLGILTLVDITLVANLLQRNRNPGSGEHANQRKKKSVKTFLF